ncbi:MAG TPA: hypothetical protein VFV52_15460 [Bacilli bacterium]|nr:hypothetical protein [Bacilli bacterium]
MGFLLFGIGTFVFAGLLLWVFVWSAKISTRTDIGGKAKSKG